MGAMSEINDIRVGVLGVSVDNSTTWTNNPPAARNTLHPDARRIVNQAITDLYVNTINTKDAVDGFDDRFTTVVGDEAPGQPDEAAFAAIGSNLIQAVADLIAHGPTG